MKTILTLAVAAAALAVTAIVPAKAQAIDPLTGKPLQGPGMGGVAYTRIPRENVDIDEKYAPGTILVRTSEKRLYYVTDRGRAIRYGIGVGREGFQFSGTYSVTRKAEWPGWTPPAEMHARQPGLPQFMPGGPNNPLGARALYVGSTLYRIHGSNEPWSIGHEVSSGCIRMLNEDVIHLYNMASIGSKIIVTHN
ncbi:MAG: L,D-transpeptidase [Flavobacteriaceae bacterium]